MSSTEEAKLYKVANNQVIACPERSELNNIPLHKLHSPQEWDEIFTLLGGVIQTRCRKVLNILILFS